VTANFLKLPKTKPNKHPNQQAFSRFCSYLKLPHINKSVIGLQPSLVQLYRDFAADGGAAKGGQGHDDVCAIATLVVALRAVQRGHLRLQREKTQLFSWDGDLPEGIALAGKVLEGVFEVVLRSMG
jgi:hypothetical protein